MIKILPVLFILLVTNVTAQNKDYIISTNGLGAIRLDMTQAELEKVLAKKVPLTNPWDTISGSWQDSAKIWYKDIDVDLRFQRTYIKEDSFFMRVIGIKVNSPLCKTKDGIGIGSGKLQVIAAFEGYYIDISPDYNEDRTTKSKTASTISIRKESEGNTIWFNLVNKKVVSFEIFPVFDDEE